METEKIIKEYRELKIEDAIDYKKFNLFLITNHSTVIEGSSLSEIETQLLLDENITPKGKPLEHSLMTKDHYNALLFTLNLANNKTLITSNTLKEISSKIMKLTGAVYDTALRKVDVTKGNIRKMNVFAGKRSFPNYDKVPELLDNFCNNLNKMIYECEKKYKNQLELAFWAHFNLVSIHPFADGNGRLSRLIMNYVQEYFNLPLSIVFKEDKTDYLNALEAARNENNISLFYSFMFNQYNKYLSSEIDNYNKNTKGFSFLF
ncbi:MAG: Fic family protein [Bacteroidales bacterium]|nr:Fic family protein [Bacteroidales bacterium]MBN2757827.1 Fic family protein [Bacteroidales bacterium]